MYLMLDFEKSAALISEKPAGAGWLNYSHRCREMCVCYCGSRWRSTSRNNQLSTLSHWIKDVTVKSSKAVVFTQMQMSSFKMHFPHAVCSHWQQTLLDWFYIFHCIYHQAWHDLLLPFCSVQKLSEFFSSDEIGDEQEPSAVLPSGSSNHNQNRYQAVVSINKLTLDVLYFGARSKLNYRLRSASLFIVSLLLPIFPFFNLLTMI